MSEATPGPWTLGHLGEDGSFEVGTYEANGSPTLVIASRNRIFHRADESRANGRLIAAAPDLLRACRMVADMAVSWQPLSPGDIADVKRAIEKAEGR